MTHPSRDTITSEMLRFCTADWYWIFYIFIYNNLKYFFNSGRYLQVQQWPHFTVQQPTAWIYPVRQDNGSHAPIHMILDVRLFFSSALGGKKIFFCPRLKGHSSGTIILFICLSSSFSSRIPPILGKFTQSYRLTLVKNNNKKLI